MVTAELVVPEPAAVPAQYKPSDAAIALLAERYMPLTIAGIDDVEGFREVHAARMVVKGHRVDIEKTRKALKEDALKYGRIVDTEAKRLTALLDPIETHLETEEKRIADEKDRIKNAARLKAEAEAKAKAEAEAARIKAEQEQEAARLRAEREKLEAERAFEAAKQRAAQEKLDAERRAMEAERLKAEAAQRAEQEKIDAQRRAVEAEAKRLADIETARLHAIEVEKARQEAAERAKRETEERLKREANEREEAARRQAEAAEAARVRVEAMRPDREKLLAVAEAIENIEVPDAPELSAEGWPFAKRIRVIVDAAAVSIRQVVSEM